MVVSPTNGLRWKSGRLSSVLLHRQSVDYSRVDGRVVPLVFRYCRLALRLVGNGCQ